MNGIRSDTIVQLHATWTGNATVTIGLYFLALISAIAAVNIWSNEDDDAAGDQRLQSVLNAAGVAAGLAGLGLFGWGFVLFSWYVPIVALVVGLFAGTACAMLARRGSNAVSVGIICGLISLGLAAVVVFGVLESA